MDGLSWNDGLKVGNEVIDHDHQETVASLEAMAAADDLAFPGMFEAFCLHLEEHFAREEAIMLDTGFPAHPIHVGEHRRVLGEAARFRDRLRDGDAAMARAWALEMVPGWFQNHLATMDAATAAWARRAASVT